MKELIRKTKDLLHQAKTEKSHYYVADILQRWLAAAEIWDKTYAKLQPEKECTCKDDGTMYFCPIHGKKEVTEKVTVKGTENLLPKKEGVKDLGICKHCHMPIAIRNPSGFCDHLYYPENCTVCSGEKKVTCNCPISKEYFDSGLCKECGKPLPKKEEACRQCEHPEEKGMHTCKPLPKRIEKLEIKHFDPDVLIKIKINELVERVNELEAHNKGQVR